MDCSNDDDLRLLFADGSEPESSDGFADRIHRRIRRAQLRARIVSWSAGVTVAVLVGLASPWLIEGSQAVSGALSLAFDSMRGVVGKTPVMAIAVVAVLVAFGMRRPLR